MKGSNIGEFEELVPMTVGILGDDDVYGISIKDDLKKRTGRNLSIGALHTALTRLEKKGYLKSFMEGSTSNRRGRRKRFYLIFENEADLIKSIYDQRSEMIMLPINLLG